MVHPTFFALLRYALDIDSRFDRYPTADEWQQLYAEAERQSLRGVLYAAVQRLDAATAPPLPLALKWARRRETLRGLNELFNSEAARLTQLFESHGHRTAILKGQANARLYPDPLSRQPGDIDIWVDGGRRSVERLLDELGLLEGADTKQVHHVGLPVSGAAVPVEVHNLPSHGNVNRRTNRALQQWLSELLDRGTELTPEGFRVPSVAFALSMQLSHISQHLQLEGVGLRQVVDYYMLLRASTADERREVGSRLKMLGLRPVAAALMWVLGEVLHLDSSMMLTRPSRRRGRWMLDRIVSGGNFGMHGDGGQTHGLWQTFVSQRRHHWELMKFCPSEGIAYLRFDAELLWSLVATIPERIRRRSLRLEGHYDNWYQQRLQQRMEELLEMED